MSNDRMERPFVHREEPVSMERKPCPPRGRTEKAVIGKHRGQTLEQVGEDEAQSRQRSWPQTARTHLPLKQEEVAG